MKLVRRMLDDFPHTTRINLQRDETTNNLETAHLNLSLNAFSGSLTNRFVCSQSQTNTVGIDHLSPSTSTGNQPIHDNNQHLGEDHYKQHQPDHNHHNQHHNHEQQQQQQQSSSDEQYFTSDETNSSNQNIDISPTTSVSTSVHMKTEPGFPCMLTDADIGTNRKPAMVPTTAHCSDQHNLHYSLSSSKALMAPSPSNMALNFSHDLLLHQGQSVLHHHHHDINDNNGDHKPSQLELDSGNLMQSAAAANMNIWKNTMNFGLKNSAINDHGFLPSSEMNSFSNWTHGGNLNHQGAPNMTHHILDGQHLIGYPQHNQRSLHINNQDLVGASLKTQVCAAEQASFMLNSINHSVTTSQAPMSNHHTPHQSTDGSHLRSQSLDHGATTYNLSMNHDGQFYNNRSHSSTIKSTVFLHDRQGPMSLSNNHHQANHVSYHNAEHMNSSQPTTSHHVAGTSSGSSSKNIGTFRCPHCNEMFSMRNLYQSHLKTHSQEKGEDLDRGHEILLLTTLQSVKPLTKCLLDLSNQGRKQSFIVNYVATVSPRRPR